MTYEEYLKFLAEGYRPTPWRIGQYYFNTLLHVRPDLAEEIRTSVLDPFYDDTRIPAFLAALQDWWNAEG